MEKKENKTIAPSLLSILFLTIVIIIAGVFSYSTIYTSWKAPLGPPLHLPASNTSTPMEIIPLELTVQALTEKDLQATPTTQISQNPNYLPQSQEKETVRSKPLCGAPPVMTILAVGIDTSDETYLYGLADATRIIRIDFTIPKISVLSIPRDLWVEIPDISDHYGITHGKLNQSYFYGTPGMAYYDGPGQGPGLMSRTLEHNFGLIIDHYGALNVITFEKIIDAIGGIDIYLPYSIDARSQPSRSGAKQYFPKGDNHLNGEDAIRISRVRMPYSDLVRIDHQTLVLNGIKDKILDPKILPSIPKIITAFQDSLITDLSPEQIAQLTCLIPHLKKGTIDYYGVPDEFLEAGMLYSPQMRNETFVFQANQEKMREFFQLFMSGNLPSDS